MGIGSTPGGGGDWDPMSALQKMEDIKLNQAQQIAQNLPKSERTEGEQGGNLNALKEDTFNRSGDT
jgi:hypothetical protein